LDYPLALPFFSIRTTVELSGLRQLACLIALFKHHSPAKSMTASKSAAAIC
jgi:hypothetical protein